MQRTETQKKFLRWTFAELHSYNKISQLIQNKRKPMHRHQTNLSLSFGEWMEELNQIIQDEWGMSFDDLELTLCRDEYELGESPMRFYENHVEDRLNEELY